MPYPVMYFEIVGEDSKTLGDFYRSVFDWKWTEYAEGYYGFETGSESDNGIEGYMYPPTDEMPFTNYVTIVVQVEDIHETIKKLESLGGKLLLPPEAMSDQGDIMAMFTDPSGNRARLHQS